MLRVWTDFKTGLKPGVNCIAVSPRRFRPVNPQSSFDRLASFVHGDSVRRLRCGAGDDVTSLQNSQRQKTIEDCDIWGPFGVTQGPYLKTPEGDPRLLHRRVTFLEPLDHIQSRQSPLHQNRFVSLMKVEFCCTKPVSDVQ